MPPEIFVFEQMKLLHDSLAFAAHEAIPLPAERVPLSGSLEEAILTRSSTRELRPTSLTFAELGTLLHYAYGVTRDDTEAGYARPFRVVPSGGALYPLELFFHTKCVDGLGVGLYHYSPAENAVRRLRDNDLSPEISAAFIPMQRDLPHDASVLVFITGFFERSTFKYGGRGYRFALIEAGHVAQNLNLVANAMGLGCLNVAGYYDREIDEILGLDGVTQSIAYAFAVGGKAEGSGGGG